MKRTSLDTNVLVRLVTRDDPVRSARAREFLARFDDDDVGFVSVVTLVELAWVLKRGFRIDRKRIHDVIEGLLTARGIEVHLHETVTGALATARSLDMDFADVLIARLGADNGCGTTVTFDRRAAATVPGMELLA